MLVVRAARLVVHGALDAVIAHAEAERALAASPASDKHLATIVGRGHNDLGSDPSYWEALGPFLARIARSG